MNTEHALQISFYILLIIFSATAFISVASIPNWIKVREPYKKRLFYALILEIIACIIGFVRQGMTIKDEHPPIISSEFLEQYKVWRWDYGPSGWRTSITFDSDQNRLSASGATEFHGKKIFDWATTSPVNFSKDGTIDFVAKQSIASNIGEIMGPNAPRPGTHEIKFKLKPILAFSGTWKTVNAPDGGETYQGTIDCFAARDATLKAGSQAQPAPASPPNAGTTEP
ncbi:hypothetical protein [Corallococcus sp. AB045]|uniref:hypothetical protein n=1 Tax=Corallococcus sp. AB045 TaxID=2316719 RepID=UPI0011C3D313|nr:hypothetical protein [Corallococcus sp. AB045]